MKGNRKSRLLSDICFFEKGKNLTKQNMVKGKYPVIGGGVTPSGYHSEFNHPEGSITVSASGASSGYVWLHRTKIYATDCFIVRPKNTDELNSEYLYYFLKKIQKEIFGLAHGGGIPHVYSKDVGEFKISYPSLPDQKKIIEVLISADKNIESINQKINKLEQIKIGMMNNLFTKGIGSSSFKDTEIGPVPTSWDIFTLERMGNEIIRGASPRPQGDPRYYGGKIPRLMGADVTRDGKVTIPQIDFLTEEGSKLSRFLKKGTLVVTCSGDVSVPTFLGVDCCIHDGFIAFKRLSDKIDPEFLYYFFIKFKKEISQTATDGGIFVNLTTSLVKDILVALPPLPEQLEIVRILSMIDENITKVKKQKIKLEQIREGLLNDLL